MIINQDANDTLEKIFKRQITKKKKKESPGTTTKARYEKKLAKTGKHEDVNTPGNKGHQKCNVRQDKRGENLQSVEIVN